MTPVHVVVFAALLPAIILFLYIRYQDRAQPEPASWLLRGFAYGCFSVFVSLLFSGPLTSLVGTGLNLSSLFNALFTAFGLAAIPEELAKLLMLWLLLRRNPYFDEHLDGVVYAVCVGLGFASVENVMYLFQSEDWASLAVARALFAVPGHFFFAVLMGYYYSLAHFRHHRLRNSFMALAAPIVAHGIYDGLLMTEEAMKNQLPDAFMALFTLTFLLFCNELRKLGKRRISDLIELDRRNGLR